MRGQEEVARDLTRALPPSDGVVHSEPDQVAGRETRRVEAGKVRVGVIQGQPIPLEDSSNVVQRVSCLHIVAALLHPDPHTQQNGLSQQRTPGPGERSLEAHPDWGRRPVPDRWGPRQFPHLWSIERGGALTSPGTFHRQPRAGLGVGKPRDSRQQRSWSWRTIAHALAAPRAVFLTDAGCVRLDHPAAPLCECVVATSDHSCLDSKHQLDRFSRIRSGNRSICWGGIHKLRHKALDPDTGARLYGVVPGLVSVQQSSLRADIVQLPWAVLAPLHHEPAVVEGRELRKTSFFGNFEFE
mmetsp:Transcript_28067/g.63470  ORF Transcript_28067/g.63470 Transcript_28067/m.63470 type:complete len:298 (+) Transcript_28067:3242-4135(+)